MGRSLLDFLFGLHPDKKEQHILRVLHRLEKTINRIEDEVKAITQPKAIDFYIIQDGQQILLGGSMQLKVSDMQKINLSIKDKFGNAAAVDGKPSWSLTDASLASLEVADDGMSANVKPSGAVGSFQIQASCDADLGEGVKTIFGTLDMDLLPGEAVSVELAGGDVSPQA